MSKTSLSDGGLPPIPDLEKALRHAVQSVYKSGNLEELTVKRIRKVVEKDMDLPDDFFKNHAEWKDKSKEVISSEVDAHEQSKEVSSTPTPIKGSLPTRKAPKDDMKARGAKRASTEKAEPKKRRKKNTSTAEACANEEEVSRKKPIGKAKTKGRRASSSRSSSSEESTETDGAPDVQNSNKTIKKTQTGLSDSELSDMGDETPKPKRSREQKSVEANKKTNVAKVTEPSKESKESKTEDVEKSESEMSELIDEPPKPKRSRKSVSTEPKPKNSKGSKGNKTAVESADPDTEEIKRLQGWLVKCGIRKMWFKELAPYDSSTDKIKHLKRMLADAGMSGRYSEAKAEQIREERELRADLEAVQEGDKMWGQVKAEEDPVTGKPKRRLAKGFEGLDFLNDDDGEETD